jgi:hypothetical protein
MKTLYKSRFKNNVIVIIMKINIISSFLKKKVEKNITCTLFIIILIFMMINIIYNNNLIMYCINVFKMYVMNG